MSTPSELLTPTTEERARVSRARFESVSDAAHYRADHDVLEALAEHIIATITEGDRTTRVSEAITVLQASLAAHLADEERELVPRYEMQNPEDATRILREHAEIRKVLSSLDVETDLHLIRADAIRAFLISLRAHAAHENEGMYRWAARSIVVPQ